MRANLFCERFAVRTAFQASSIWCWICPAICMVLMKKRCSAVREVAWAITPVPGGVGLLTNVGLLKQCVQAVWQLAGENEDVKTAA